MVNGGGWAVVCGGFQGLVSPNPTAVLVALLLGLWLLLGCDNTKEKLGGVIFKLHWVHRFSSNLS